MQWRTSSEASIASSAEYQIAETATFQKLVESPAHRRNYQKILKDVYPKLRANPYFGPNIRRLTGNLESIFRYRIGDYRLFYSVDPAEKRIYILGLHDRKDAYKKR